MAKKGIAGRQKRKKLNSIDNIPSFTKQRRSSAPKRRSDFSSFFFSSLSNSGSFEHGLPSITMTSLYDTKVEEKDLPALAMVLQFRKFTDKKLKLLSEFYEAPVVGVESVAQNTTLDHFGDSKQTRALAIESMPEKSRVTESSSVCATPGNIVWAKSDCQMWWPAEIIGETSSIADSRSRDIDGHVLVQFYGDQGSAWVDPVRDISQLEDCFEERSCNTTEKFQDALRQALKWKEDLSSCGQLARSVDGSSHPCQQDQSFDKCTSSISSRTELDVLPRRKSSRKQKPKHCFDEVVYPVKSPGKIRRLRIMRYLGLVAPVGSPF